MHSFKSFRDPIAIVTIVVIVVIGVGTLRARLWIEIAVVFQWFLLLWLSCAITWLCERTLVYFSHWFTIIF